MLDQFYKMPVAKKALILGVVMMLVGLVFWYAYYSPLTEELDSQKTQYTRARTELAEVEKRKKTYDEDLQRREDLKIASVKQREMLPVETEMPSFLNNLNTVADLTGLEILAVKPLEASPEKYYARIPVELTLRGNYLQFSKFFYQVGKLDRIINLENLNFTRPEITESGVQLNVVVLATTFRALESEAGGPKKNKGK